MKKQQLKMSIDGQTLIMERVFNAPRELVFSAHGDPDRIAQWWGPRGWSLSHNQMDFRPRGTWHYCMQGPAGEESWGLTTYKEIVEPHRIVYTDVFSDSEGNVAEGMPEMQVISEFSDEGGKTRLTSRTRFASIEDLNKVIEMGVEEGAAETWDRLAEYVEKAG